MSFDSLLCLIPFTLAYLSFSIWLHERDSKGKGDWTLMLATVLCTVFGAVLLIYV